MGHYHCKPVIYLFHLFSNLYLWSLLVVFGLRYIRVISNIIGDILYMPTSLPRNPKYNASDVTVTIPTIGLDYVLLHQVIESILVHPITRLLVVASGPDFQEKMEAFRELVSDSRVQLFHCDHAARRRKTALAMPHIGTSLAILQNNKTVWPASPNFLPFMMALFEDHNMGAVMPLIKARHHHHHSWKEAVYNFLGMT